MAKVKVTAPTKREDVVVGVTFKGGVGVTDDPAAAAFFRRRGWEVAPVRAAAAAKDNGKQADDASGKE